MRELKQVRVLTENVGQFQLTLPKRKVRQIFKPSNDDKYYVRVDFEDNFIKVTPLEIVANEEETSLQDSIEELKKRLSRGGENADGS